MQGLVAAGKWVAVSESNDIAYLPNHPNFGEDGTASLASCRIFVYRKV